MKASERHRSERELFFGRQDGNAAGTVPDFNRNPIYELLGLTNGGFVRLANSRPLARLERARPYPPDTGGTLS